MVMESCRLWEGTTAIFLPLDVQYTACKLSDNIEIKPKNTAH